MEFRDLSKDSLVRKLTAANREIVQLKQEQQIKTAIEKEKSKIEHDLRERIKELNCLYGVAELIEENYDDLDTAIQGIISLIIKSWQYSEIATCRIIINGREIKGPRFKSTPWKQSAYIMQSKERIGILEVYYLDEMPKIDEGPFLKEERLLINDIAIRIGGFLERISEKRQLKDEQLYLQNANIALKEVLKKVKEEQNDTSRTIHANVERMVTPLLHSLRKMANQEQSKFIDLIESSLNDILSPFIQKLSYSFMGLTPKELQICNLIRYGLSTKEIAEIMYISGATVSRHRENIRKKLRLNNKKINLPTFLRSHMMDEPEMGVG